ncbi:MAG: hypothetical protein EXS14_06265 [Planctomycetes bacterium]|nr:hypothetical protein [Planctomycetota bacterium]
MKSPGVKLSLLLLLATASVAQTPWFTVVTPRAFLPALTEYISARRCERPVEVLLLEDVLAHHEGIDAAETLKHHLFRSYQRGTRYVLLVGDVDALPVRYMVLDRQTAVAANTAFYPSDLYFADIVDASGAFEDWNSAKDGHHAAWFGEVHGETYKDGAINADGVHYTPELAVGRWPASNASEVACIASKTLRHVRELPQQRKALLLHGADWIDMRARMDGWGRTLDPHYSATRINHAHGEPAADAAVAQALHAGVDFLVHVGHGSPDGYDRMLSTMTLAGCTPLRLPVLLSAGCSTAAFAAMPPYSAYTDSSGFHHAGTNFGEVFTRPPPAPACFQCGPDDCDSFAESAVVRMPNGAVAAIGCNTGAQPCGVTLVEAFVEGAARQGTLLGDCWRDALAAYVDREHLHELKADAGWYPPSIFFQGMKFMLFGDPTLRL